jgi:hypothetical protein
MASKSKKVSTNGKTAKFPRHSVERALRIPVAIIDQNAGKECSDSESAKFVGVGFNGPYRVEISSSIKYGFLERPKAGYISVTQRARQAIRPQTPEDRIKAFREAVLAAPDISDVYTHYRGENLPDGQFFENALVDKFGIPAEKTAEFTTVFADSLRAANLVEEKEGKQRLLDISAGASTSPAVPDTLRKISQGVKITTGDTCFVVMPFGAPIGGYYQHVYEPAIQKAGLRPVRADAEIFDYGPNLVRN